jgi:signal transduction histidine kinase
MKMLTAAENAKFLELVNKMNDTELRAASTTIRNAWKVLENEKQFQAAVQFRLNDSVYFTDKYGRKIVGMIEKINPKNIKVRVKKGSVTGQDVVWTVSPSLLSMAA